MSAMTKIHHSGILGSISMTRSPFLTPYFRRMFAAPLERFRRSRKEYFFSFPCWSTQIIASLFRSVPAHRSITSYPKLKYSGTSILKLAQAAS